MTKYAQVLNGIVIHIVDLTDEQFKELMDYGVDCEMVDLTNTSPLPIINWTYDSDTLSFSEPDLMEIKSKNKAKVDASASAKRTILGTTIRDQAEVYIAKATEAEKYISYSYPVDLTNYPWIQLEVTASGLTTTEIADTIKSNYDSWMTNLQTIELERRKGKINIDSATNYDEVITATTAAMTAIDGLVF
jgi:hypothetical protein